MTEKKKKTLQSKVYEFIPTECITRDEIVELSRLVRIGVGGHIIEYASEGLRRHFREVKNDNGRSSK